MAGGVVGYLACGVGAVRVGFLGVVGEGVVEVGYEREGSDYGFGEEDHV